MKNQKNANDIDGLIVLDKDKGFTSNDSLAITRKLLNLKKIGHTGTLDVNATGVLVALLNSATKCQEYLMRAGDKEYEAELILGISTDTEDITGNITNIDENVLYAMNSDEASFNEIYDKFIKAKDKFIGGYDQVPPMYSAKKIEGKKLINMARKGVDIERKPCHVNIYDITVNGIKDYELKSGNEDIKVKAINIKVRCGKGTYIRTLCKDLGLAIGLNACMGNLRRTRNFDFKIEDSITLDEMKKKIEEKDFSFIKPCYYMDTDTVVTFGKFETLHLGHQKIIDIVVDEAKKANLRSVAMIVGANLDDEILTKEQRVSKLDAYGIDKIINYRLDEVSKTLSAKNFIDEILCRELRAKVIVVGDDCRFGYKASGDSKFLKEECEKLGIKVIVVEKLKVEDSDRDISSTLIKEAYKNGDIALVNKLLGKE